MVNLPDIINYSFRRTSIAYDATERGMTLKQSYLVILTSFSIILRGRVFVRSVCKETFIIWNVSLICRIQLRVTALL